MIKLLSLFSGIGAFEKALTNQKIPFELVNYCEFDKYASKSYSLIHNEPESKNLGDITKIDVKSLPSVDLITYGFPCQDISLAGYQKGFHNDDGTLTRSGLFFEALKIIEYCKPKVAIAENVKNLTSKRFSEQFRIVLDSLEAAGYNNYWKVLNSKDFGIPQNRERVFIVSIRKDLDTGVFEFPEPYELKLRLKDLLEDEVDEKYYLSDAQIKRMQTTNFSSNNFATRVSEEDGIVNTLCARDWKDPKCVIVPNAIITDKVMQIGNCRPTKTRQNPNQGRVYDPEGISPALNCMGGGNREPHIITPILAKTEEGVLVRNATKKGYDVAKIGDSIDLEQASSTTRRGRVGHGVCQTLNTSDHKAVVVNPSLRIRKLTPKECFRLQGFDDADVDACVNGGISNTQLYKQAGNSITVDVLEELFCMMFDENGELYI